MPSTTRIYLTYAPEGDGHIFTRQRRSALAEANKIPTESTYIQTELENNLHDRLSRIEGHVRGIKTMLA